MHYHNTYHEQKNKIFEVGSRPQIQHKYNTVQEDDYGSIQAFAELDT